jgi:hypothetical protein
MRLKTVILMAVAMVFAAVSGAAAHTCFPAFPNNSSIFQNVSGTFSNLSGIARKLRVIYVTSASNRIQRISDRNGTDKGVLFQSTSDNFWQFADTIVFPDTGDRMDIDGFLLPGFNGRAATGSAAFTFISPAVSPRSGTQVKITGAAVVRVIGNRMGTRAAVKVFNIQASQVTVTTFSGTTSISSVHGDAILRLFPILFPMKKTFTNQTTID